MQWIQDRKGIESYREALALMLPCYGPDDEVHKVDARTPNGLCAAYYIGE